MITYLEDINTLNIYLANEEDIGTIQSQKVIIKMKHPSPGDLSIELRRDGVNVGDFIAVSVNIADYYQYEYDLEDDKTWDLGQFTVSTWTPAKVQIFHTYKSRPILSARTYHTRNILMLGCP